MRCTAVIEADLDISPIGTRSRLGDELRGEPVLARTVRRILGARSIEKLFVLCPSADQASACAALMPSEVDGRVEVRETRVKSRPYAALVRTARKWSLDGWRGGLGGTCVMDEHTRSDELALLAHEQAADAVFCAPAASPLLDPGLADTLIRHADQTKEEARLTFTPAPPGLTGAVYRTDLLIELAQKAYPPGLVLSYKPAAPQMDLAFKSCCYTAPAAVRHAGGRLIVDTDRAWRTADAYLETGLPIEAERVGQWLIEREASEVPPLPREVEIELTTEDQLPNALLRPRGAQVGRRGPIDVEIIQAIAVELAAFDDSLVVLGGFGEPLLHPRFQEILGILSRSGVYGVAVRSNGLGLDEARTDALIDHGVDVLNVVLDAWSRELYARVQGADVWEKVRANLDVLTKRRGQRQSVAPILVPEMTKSTETVDELDAFFDGWVTETGCACISGYSHYAGQRADLSVIRMSPPKRTPCRRLRDRATVLADGRVLACDQDFTGAHAVGDLHGGSLGDCWHGATMRRARERHAGACFDAIPLCVGCEEWHRP